MELKCFVMMPFGSNGEYHYGPKEGDIVFNNIIKPAIEKAAGDRGARVHREVDKNESGSITSSIIQQIAKADICIVDLTGRNPNVFLELGIRFALRKKTTVLMHQNTSDLPFDVQSYRSFKYTALEQERYATELSEVVSQSLNSESRSDSLVFDVVPQLNEYIPHEETIDAIMPWNDYFSRLENISENLRDASVAGLYKPDAIVGISNGGAMFADLLAMRSSFNCPVVTLWADRHNKQPKFDNELNQRLVKGLIENSSFEEKEDDQIRILLVDDIIASGGTYDAALKFLEALKDERTHLRFLPFCFKENSHLDKVYDNLIWNHKAFELDPSSVLKLHKVHWHKFPYNKDLRST